ncbi:MAG: hypothetical protein GY926_23000 [bacterium]|nr:hypothetical protein [bacterium]
MSSQTDRSPSWSYLIVPSISPARVRDTARPRPFVAGWPRTGPDDSYGWKICSPFWRQGAATVSDYEYRNTVVDSRLDSDPVTAAVVDIGEEVADDLPHPDRQTRHGVRATCGHNSESRADRIDRRMTVVLGPRVTCRRNGAITTSSVALSAVAQSDSPRLRKAAI